MFKLFKVTYHYEMIHIMLQSTFVGILAVNIVTPFLLATLFYPYVDNNYLYIWLIFNTLLFIFRVLFLYYARKEHLKENSKVNKILYLMYILIFLSAFLHFIALFYISLQGSIPELYLFFMAIITISLIAGSSATLGSVFTAQVVYVTSNTLGIIIVFLYHSGDIYYMFTLAALIFMFVNLKSGWMQYKLLSENIQLKESFETRIIESKKEIKIQEKLLQRQSRLVQMGEMISMIAHQWRQPLNAISATSAALHLKTQLNKSDTKYILQMTDNISEYSQHLSETIDDFRNFFKPDKEKNETSFDEILHAVLSIVKVSLSNHKIALILDMQCHEIFFSYSNELKQVILNLVTNAQDALLENRVEEAYIKIITKKDANQFIMQVSDNGGGIPLEYKDKIFAPYFSTKTTKDGTGLGLYMSKLIVEEHCRGRLSMCNTAFGALFEISLGREEKLL